MVTFEIASHNGIKIEMKGPQEPTSLCIEILYEITVSIEWPFSNVPTNYKPPRLQVHGLPW